MIKDEGIITHWVKLNFPHHPQSLMDLLVDRICDAELDYKAERRGNIFAMEFRSDIFIITEMFGFQILDSIPRPYHNLTNTKY